MGRARVRSFLSAFGPPSSRNTDSGQYSRPASGSFSVSQPPPRYETPSPDASSLQPDSSPAGSVGPPWPERLRSRPESTLFTHTPPSVDTGDDTPPELQPIFSLLNSHANKLYQEGYFLKLNDLDIHGRNCPDRQWVECYAQLIGTALTVWDAAALDAAGEDGDVPPTFINLADASVKMIETLPTRNKNVEPLKNILSICSAGHNRYLLHFNSFHSLTQWTAAIRLTIYELTSLHEAYTGSIIAGKGKRLNNIQSILGPFRFKYEDWARVRFGPGTPWRRCWFVINPPDEKELQKVQKSMKKRSAYDRAPRLVMGDIKFYESKKTKKVTPIATIDNAYAAYAIYPQSKSLIDQSTLLKIEGRVTTHSQPVSTTEGFVFVMPEVHPALSGFEMLLRFLIPTFDTFCLYGRPTRLIAETNHIKSIMFAFPKHRRHGYLDTLDVANLLQTPGSQNWSEEEWRKQLKGATSSRMAAVGSSTSSVAGSDARFRSGIANRRGNVRVESAQLPKAAPLLRPEFNKSADAIKPEVLREEHQQHHARGSSDTTGVLPAQRVPRNFSAEDSPEYSAYDLTEHERVPPMANGVTERSSSDSGERQHENTQVGGVGETLQPPSAPAPVSIPPQFTHGPREMPSVRPRAPSDVRMANRMSNTTLAQLAAAGRLNIPGTAGHGDHQNTRDMNMPFQQPTALNEPGRSKLETIGDSENTSAEAVAPRERATPTPPYAPPVPPKAPTVPAKAPPVPEHAPPVPQHAPPVPQHAPPQPDRRQGIVANIGAPRFQSNTSSEADEPKAIKRKPAPQTQPRQTESQIPSDEPSFDDLRHAVDEDALNQVRPRRPSDPSPVKGSQDEESLYDDGSTTSPDYASTHGSTYSKQSTARPRMGVVKTVGSEAPPKDVLVGDAYYALKQPQGNNSDIPSVDFGPTLSYFPTTGRPRTADNPSKNFGHHRIDPDTPERYRRSAAAAPKDRAHSNSPSRDELRRSMAWQPGMATGRSRSPGFGLTPEQYVQQRAAQQPVHVHRRSPSSLEPRPRRPSSGDWTGHSRGNSNSTIRAEMPPRPNSRNANNMLNYNDVSSHLTAREQEHVARMTGSSFFNLSSSSTKQPAPVNPMGLVGAIDAREREKQGMKEGLSNKMVQHAIAQRQQQQQNLLQQQQRYAQATPGDNYTLHPGSQSMYNLPAASRSWDAFNNYPNQGDTRRGSWYGPYAPAPQPTSYQQSQVYGQHPGYWGNPNTMHY